MPHALLVTSRSIHTQQVSAEELQQAITKILNKKISAEEAAEIVDLLDRDHDGKVSVLELVDYAKERKKKQEVEALEVSHFRMS
jgi:Ca2+-binding EF-hand superfamily protein